MRPDAPERGFPVAEFEMRTGKAQASMAEQGLSGLLLMTEPEVRYFSGFPDPLLAKPDAALVPVRPGGGQAHRRHPRNRCGADVAKLDRGHSHMERSCP